MLPVERARRSGGATAARCSCVEHASPESRLEQRGRGRRGDGQRTRSVMSPKVAWRLHTRKVGALRARRWPGSCVVALLTWRAGLRGTQSRFHGSGGSTHASVAHRRVAVPARLALSAGAGVRGFRRRHARTVNACRGASAAPGAGTAASELWRWPSTTKENRPPAAHKRMRARVGAD